MEKARDRTVQRRTLRLVGYAMLLVTIGVVSCQSLFGATLAPSAEPAAPSPVPVIGDVIGDVAGDRPAR